MTDTPAWTDETRDLAADTIAKHVDVIQARGGLGQYQLTCDAGDWTWRGTTAPAIMSEAARKAFRRHRAEAVLSALTERGLLLPADAETRHVIELRTDGWTIMHPLACRPRLFDCLVNRVGEELPGPPRGRLGRFPCELVDDELVIDYGDDHV